MIEMLAQKPENVRQFYSGVEWNWVEDIRDDTELDREWEAHQLGLEEMILGRRLSEEEADCWQKWWLKSSRAFRHVEEFRHLTRTSYKFYVGLSKAGAQDLLGERTGLERLEPVMQPSPLVRFRGEYPPDPPAPWTAEYEREVGGPQAVGARLVWWGAGAESPTEFGFPHGFFNQLLAQPIWSVVQDDTVRANSAAFELMRDAASAVCRVHNGLMESDQSASVEEAPPQHGPWEGYTFWWEGHPVHLTPQLWKLLDFIWKHRSVVRERVMQQVWEEPQEQKTRP